MRSAQDSANRAPGGTGTAQRAQIGMMHVGPGDVRSPINLPATQGFDIYPQERPHQPHQPHWMPHGVDPHNHMPVRHMAEGPAAAPGSTVPMVDGQGRYEAPTLQQLQIWHHMNAERTPPASLVQDSVQRPIALRPAETDIQLARLYQARHFLTLAKAVPGLPVAA